MERMMRLRPYIPETDFEIIRNWIADPRSHALWCANRFEYPLSRENFNSVLRDIRIRNGDSPFTAAGADGTAMGFFCYSLHPDTNEGLLKFVIVDPAARGQGLGRAMLRLAVEYAFEISKADAVSLRVFTENPRAVRCYESVGFTEERTEKDAFSYGDESWGRRSMVIRRSGSGCGAYGQYTAGHNDLTGIRKERKMRIGIIQASSQANKNEMIFQAVQRYAADSEVINFGCTPEDSSRYSYIDISLLAGMLLAADAVDLIVTGCSSGQGMMLACNSFPGVLCGYIPTPMDAYLFAQINNGNAVSLPLGEEYTWAGRDNLEQTIRKLFAEPFGQGYPKEEASRKRRDTALLKKIRAESQTSIIGFLNSLDQELLKQIMSKRDVMGYILKNGTCKPVVDWVRKQELQMPGRDSKTAAGPE